MDTHQKIKLLQDDLKVLEDTTELLWAELKKVRKHESDENEEKWIKISGRISANQLAISKKKENIETLLISLQTNLF